MKYIPSFFSWDKIASLQVFADFKKTKDPSVERRWKGAIKTTFTLWKPKKPLTDPRGTLRNPKVGYKF